MKRSQAFAVIACVTCGTAFAGEPPPLAQAPFDADQARQFQQQWSAHIGVPLVHTSAIGMKLMLIPPGEFRMGVSEKETYERLSRHMLRSSNILERNPARDGGLLVEMPAHRVRLTRPFYLGITEVTVAQFRRFAEATGYETDAERGLVYGKPYSGKKPIRTWRTPLYPDRPRDQQRPRDNDPVMHVDWNDCMAFCRWLSKTEARKGYEYSLPTSAEWEFACRAGTTSLWYFGDEDAFNRLVPRDEYISWKGKSPRVVGQGKPNPFGLYDMHGNMMEWMADWLHDWYYLESPLNDPAGPSCMNEERNRRRMVRGGAFEVGRYWSRSAWYVRIAQGSNQHRHPGFRVAMHIKGVEGVPLAPEPNMRIVGEDRIPAEPAAAQQAAVTRDRPKELTIKLNEDVSMEFVLVPPGSFLMGSLKGGRYERPVHQVTISQPFYIGRYEVTQQQYDAVMGEDDRIERWGKYSPVRYRPRLVGPRKPMHYLSWNDWQEFVDKVRQKVPGREFGLPTEAQWEYACRAGSTTEYSFGDDPERLHQYASFCPDDALRWRDRKNVDFTVGRRKPNAWGIHDMHGNVQEWCSDWWDKDYYSRSPRIDPQGPENGNFKVLRGGTIRNYGRFTRSAFRFRMLPDLQAAARSYTSGARLVINLPPSDPIPVTHRRRLRHAPESTLSAFAGCLEPGVGFEFDIRTTKDGRLVALHDDTLGRTTSGPNRSIREFTLADLKKFDAGSWFHSAFSDERVPILEETCVLIKQRRRGHTIIAINVKDISADGEKRLVELAEKYDLLSDSFVFDQSEESSRRLKSLNSKLQIGANVNRRSVVRRLKEGLLDVFLVTFVPTAEGVPNFTSTASRSWTTSAAGARRDAIQPRGLAPSNPGSTAS